MWIDNENGTVVNRHDEIRDLRPQMTLPAILTDEIILSIGFDQIINNQPSYNHLQEDLIDDGIEFKNGAWHQVWKIIPKKPELILSERLSSIDRQWAAIKEMRNALRVGGVAVEVNDKTYWFHSDDTSRIQQLGLILMGASMPPNLEWKTMSGEFVPMTPALATKVLHTIAVSDQTIFHVAEHHKVRMETAVDPATYDFSRDWPAIYSETLTPNAE